MENGIALINVGVSPYSLILYALEAHVILYIIGGLWHTAAHP